MQPNVIALQSASIRRSEAVEGLVSACNGLLKKLEESKNKIISLILPVALLVSSGKKSVPEIDPHEILKRYRYESNPNAENIINLSALFDVWEYTESIKAMINSGEIEDDILWRYQEELETKLLEKDLLAQKIDFAEINEIEAAFYRIVHAGEEDS